MPIGAVTLAEEAVKAPSQMLYADEITVVGDGAYPTGGSLGLQAALRALTKDRRRILAVVDLGLNGGYRAVWDPEGDSGNGTLVILRTGSADSPAAQVPNATNLAGVTFRLLVISK